LARRRHLLPCVEQGGIAVVDHDLAPVDAPGGVAPVCERSSLLYEFFLEPRNNGVGGVVELGDLYGLGAYPADR
jgi:hypothetical protein